MSVVIRSLRFFALDGCRLHLRSMMFISALLLNLMMQSYSTAQDRPHQLHRSIRGQYSISFPMLSPDSSPAKVEAKPVYHGRSFVESTCFGVCGEDVVKSDEWTCSVRYEVGFTVQPASEEEIDRFLSKERKILSTQKLSDGVPESVNFEFICEKNSLSSVVRVIQVPGRRYLLEFAERKKEKVVKLTKKDRQAFFSSLEFLNPSDAMEDQALQAEGKDRADNVLGLKMIWVPAGKFEMGTRRNQPGYRDLEAAANVELTQGFWLASTETTQSQWTMLVGTAPYLPKTEVTQIGVIYSGYRPVGPNIPFHFSTVAEALEFCAILTDVERAEGRIGHNWCYTLPTEAQWEYACRAGSTSIFCYGDDPGKLTNYAWFEENSGKPGQRYCKEIAKKKPNAWGFFDMHGNVAEICLDLVQPSKEFAAGTDPIGTHGSSAVRGGDIGCSALGCRSAARRETSSGHVGFRIALVRSDVLDPEKLHPIQLAQRVSVIEPKAKVNKLDSPIPRQEMLPRDSIVGDGPLSGVKMVWCPAGSFLMGSRPGQQWRGEASSCQPTWISRGFYISTTEITSNAAHALGWTKAPETRSGGDGPARINYHKINRLCEQLTATERKAGRLPEGYVYRLPTEAEWEYACRAGTNTTFFWGDRSEDREQYLAVNHEDSSSIPVRAVAQLKPNAWGLYDMIGNAPEYCLDLYQPYLMGGLDPCCTWGDIIQPVVRGRISSSDRSRGNAPLIEIHSVTSRPPDGFRLVLGPPIKVQNHFNSYPRDTAVALEMKAWEKYVQNRSTHFEMLQQLLDPQFVELTGLMVPSIKYEELHDRALNSASSLAGPAQPLLDKELLLFADGTVVARNSADYLINPSSFTNRLGDHQRNINEKTDRILRQAADQFALFQLSARDRWVLKLGWYYLHGPDQEFLQVMGYSEKHSRAIHQQLNRAFGPGQSLIKLDIQQRAKAVRQALEKLLDADCLNLWDQLMAPIALAP